LVTLGSGATPGSDLGGIGLVKVCSDGLLLVTWLKMSARSRRAARVVVSMPHSGLAQVGFRMAVMRSLTAAQAASREAVFGIGTCKGNHSRVSAMRSALVLMAKTR
jgi:hypothetical protein